MEAPKAIFINAWPYQKDIMNLPVKDVKSSIPFYENMMGFTVTGQHTQLFNSVILLRGDIKIGISENGGDPRQDGCFFEVDNLGLALEEMKSKGLPAETEIKTQQHGDTEWKVFFIIAPDELCYCIGERL